MEANYFTILYWFCHTSTWIHHGCTRVPHPEPHSHLPPHPIPLGHPSAPALSILYHALNLDWRFVSHVIIYMFQCHSHKSSHPCPLPQSPKDCSIHLYTCPSKWTSNLSKWHYKLRVYFRNFFFFFFWFTDWFSTWHYCYNKMNSIELYQMWPHKLPHPYVSFVVSLGKWGQLKSSHLSRMAPTIGTRPGSRFLVSYSRNLFWTLRGWFYQEFQLNSLVSTRKQISLSQTILEFK